MKNIIKLAGGFLVGYVATNLLTPHDGYTMRKRIANTWIKTVKNVKMH